MLCLLVLCASVPVRDHPSLMVDAQLYQFAVVRSGVDFVVQPRKVPSNPIAANELAIGTFNDSIAQIGWATLAIKTNPNAVNRDQMMAAGYLEGYLTASRIQQHAINTGVISNPPSQKLLDFIQNNIAWMSENIANDPEPYWNHIDALMAQVRGIHVGYLQGAAPGENTLSMTQIVLLNMAGDLEDLSDALSGDRTLMSDPFRHRSHCSALVRLTQNNTDLLVSQTTWSSAESMMRIYKLYDFPLHIQDASQGQVPAVRSAFSSYPGTVYSGDDFYTLSSGLVVQETTIGNSNPDLYEQFISPETVLDWIRNPIANRLAHSAEEWGTIFSRYNSGTYNNQFMIVDMNLFAPGKQLVNGTFFVCEQIPGFVKCEDTSSELQSKGYFGSYNIARDPFIRNISGVDHDKLMLGDWFDYWLHPRGRIFARDAPSVNTIADLKRLMRYNDFKNDELSSQLGSCEYLGMTNCTPPYTGENAISCRSDLNPADGVYAFSALGHRDHMSTDCKITSFSMLESGSLASEAISGPTNDQQPTFVFSQSGLSVSHVGLPDAWDFPWVTFQWN